MRLAEYPDDIAFATAIGILPTGPVRPGDEPQIPPRLMAEARLFRRLGLSKSLISGMLVRASRHGTTLEAELLASGVLKEDTYYEALAEILHLPFLSRLDPAQVEDLPGADSQLVEPSIVRIHHPARPPITAIVPSADRIESLNERLDLSPMLRTMLAATTPSALRTALWQAGRTRRLRETVDRLFATLPEASARITLWGRQGFYMGTILTTLLALAITEPVIASLLLHIVLSLLFLASFLIRFLALLAKRRQQQDQALGIPSTGPRPVYSVFVALYREAAVVPQLVETLNRLAWPAACLDIKLICEADDEATLSALAAIRLGRQYEIVAVPPGHPRTKPKALSYALGAARGAYLVIYDAEDRIDPLQLDEAWRTFEAGPSDIVCLQAPLVITNARESWLSALFAFEYAGLFRVLLPRLAAARLPMPLGGTSNHFRTRVLQEVGGWDPYNVTEDADLGMRLYRLGYRCGTIERPTYEEAPTTTSAWLGQRTRWFKGWLQTWLVLMRRPSQLMRDMGLWPCIVFQVLIGGLILSSLAHPLLFVYVGVIAWQLFGQSAHVAGPFEITLIAVDIVNIFGSYAIFVALGRAGMTPGERDAAGRCWALTPFYWLLMSLAAWRAVRELRSNPFFWNKTAHRPAQTPLRAEPVADAG
ncbi:glycosyltransferase [Shinella sp. CPCC 101442]|uniref:glycosyltransferase family 2 protein n=1 Tax=Shinella sp. CPCC 101442 TaxID=2932265 RepID=UPI0021522F52|nr:glycosyltransferase family 2 protein [Shinella sp. CPCC 101442]MCR6500867.1 glycosyltransferase [Shinella sp. CPCC 101442]